MGTAAEGAVDYRCGRFRKPVVIMVGEERGGLSDSQRALCHELVRIPMSRGMDSLNVAAATSVVLYEAWRQRHPLSGRPRAGGRRRVAADSADPER